LGEVGLDRVDEVGDAGERAGRMALSVRWPKKISIMFSQLEEVGVKCR
jgi:hypothetical protein